MRLFYYKFSWGLENPLPTSSLVLAYRICPQEPYLQCFEIWHRFYRTPPFLSWTLPFKKSERGLQLLQLCLECEVSLLDSPNFAVEKNNQNARFRLPPPRTAGLRLLSSSAGIRPAQNGEAAWAQSKWSTTFPEKQDLKNMIFVLKK